MPERRSRAAALAAVALLLACRPSAKPPAPLVDAGAPAVAAAAPHEERRASPLEGLPGTGRVARPPAAVFPLQVSRGGRHLEDQRGVPFLIKGETAWLALANLTDEEQERYLADRARRGFNLVEVMLTNHDYTLPPNPEPPSNRKGEQPFLRRGDLAAPNDAYFDRAVAFVDRAAAHGMAVLLAPLYLGFDGGREGWWQELTSEANTRAVSAGYGRYLGARFRDRPNLLWLAGGDFAPPPGSEGEARAFALLQGIRAAGATQPWTGHWNVGHQGGISTDEALFAPAMELNGVYQYASPYRFTTRAFDARPPRPVFLLESAYEHEHPGGPLQPFRKAWWWAMVSGASGVVWSNYFLWRCESARGRYEATYGETDHATSSWEAELGSPGTAEVMHLHAFFDGLPWERLVPAGTSGRPELVRAGQQSGEGHIGVAASAEGDLLVAYVPPTGAERRRFTLDLSGVRRPARARWFDPVAGTFGPEMPLPDAPEMEFQVRGRNLSGLDDWVLLIDAPSRRGTVAPVRQ